MPKWIFVTGGVLSGLGKGLVSASLGKLLESRGYKVVPVKCDGYLNVDPGTMNPVEHGEVFVMDDGGEVDMDFGHYERFMGIDTKFDWNLTSGKVFKTVIEKERKGDFLGQTVQMVPHVTDEVKSRVRGIAEGEDADIMIVEIGGTVGDIENQLYLESVRQMEGDEESVHIHLTLVPFLETVGEQKTKPTQHSVKKLRELGLSPDIVIGRSGEKLEEHTKEKISLFCDVEEDSVISNPDVNNIYKLPLVLAEEEADRQVLEELGEKPEDRQIDRWEELVGNMENPEDKVKIGLIGKYTSMDDSYVSIEEALKHAGAHFKTDVETVMVDSEEVEEEDPETLLEDLDGAIIPGGFGSRGTEGKIASANYCRENDIPLLGICFGMQMMVIEYARNVCGLEGANSTEVEEKPETEIVKKLPEQVDEDDKGGTMRLGAYKAQLKPGTYTSNIYGSNEAVERHRHRYEISPEHHEVLEENGLVIAGTSKNGLLAEYIELDNHRFYIGTQAHPEFNSRLEEPNPLYREFIKQVRKG